MLLLKSRRLIQAGANILDPAWVPIQPTWLNVTSLGKANLGGNFRGGAIVRVPDAREVVVDDIGVGHRYVNATSADIISTNSSPLFYGNQTKFVMLAVFKVVGPAVAYSAPIYSRGARLGGIMFEGPQNLQSRSDFGVTGRWSTDTGLNHTVGQRLCVAMSADCNSNYNAIAQNGRSFNYGDANGVTDFANGDGLSLGNDGTNTSRTMNGNIYMTCLIIGDSWSEAKMRAWSLNPWQIFAPRVQYVSTASDVLMPTLGTPTFVPGTLTSSGFRPRFPVTWA